ncbi:cob(II)yrinic acid a,c-diamide reductase [Acetobacter aceti NBRC 14818]|uniref:5,6-dimethylbenzimidazole synthase n=1 Tax=Acetobacter aceti NBRC 14818 TaxID=887700 RepID=A0AB33IB57_ACEAC|nr:5,6-dimethylbenzimidazole synthase [Acetobacter aceti]TCS35275.1 cob(II)yrinic acid a,c-diamide reductase [Acetobacter aceti NBRC 14818]BCK75337.1 5,6-dimethylbenzimidazole synthase [Acetobacter aceti NBRC 14818]GAN57373.1 Cob(II) yrinic acid a,c-diamide reductase [Acetobacter aceti NBRC 14818]
MTASAVLEDVFRWRRDVRHFRPEPVADATLDELLQVASMAPSVGLSEPWRFMRVDSPARRAAVRGLFARSQAEALAEREGEDAAAYARLKLAGLDDAPHHIAVFSVEDPEQGRGLGRRTMPETTVWSTVMAIHTFWLAAAARGIGVGWVSILEPDAVRQALESPASWRFIAYLCVGYPRERHDTPELERLGWERRQSFCREWIRR